VRLNDRHPDKLTPSSYGDSVGHYEADTLVIDTIGVKTDRPYAMIDLFGTPYYQIIACRRTLLAARIRRREGRQLEERIGCATAMSSATTGAGSYSCT
jgi:hypothetical protein